MKTSDSSRSRLPAAVLHPRPDAVHSASCGGGQPRAAAAPSRSGRKTQKAKKQALQICRRLRVLIYRLDVTQRKVEKRAGFSNGYLSQLLGGTAELKVWHLLAILDAVQMAPAEFFAQLFPRRSQRALEALDEYRPGSREADNALRLELAQLYGMGIESLAELRGRLEGCEAVLRGLEEQGILDRPEEEQRPAKTGRRSGVQRRRKRRAPS